MTPPAGRDTIRTAELREEARWLHWTLFGELPDDEIEAAYVRAHEFFCKDRDATTLMRVIVQHQLDAEAIELVLRKRNPLLSCKFRILVYLAEARPSHYPRLVNSEARPVWAWIALVWAGVWTGYKYVKGYMLIWRFAVH